MVFSSVNFLLQLLLLRFWLLDDGGKGPSCLPVTLGGHFLASLVLSLALDSIQPLPIVDGGGGGDGTTGKFHEILCPFFSRSIGPSKKPLQQRTHLYAISAFL